MDVRIPFERKTLRHLVETDGSADLVRLTVRDETMQDLAALGRVAVVDHRELRDAYKLYLNPSFAQSPAFNGADADVIFDSTLLDWKSTKDRGIVGRKELWQLVGYALADTPDAYDIKVVAISGLRWRRRVCWPLAHLLQELSGGPEPDIARLRTEFADLLSSARVS